MAEEQTPANQNDNRIVAFLTKLGDFGNKLPDPLTLFVLLTLGVIAASMLFKGASAEVIQRSGAVELKTVQSLMSFDGIRWMFLNAVENFVGFAPLGPVLTVMIGIGVAEKSGFISTGLKVLVSSVPPSAVTATLVFASVMSSMAADAGYVVLTPLGALLFAGMGRHPLAGLVGLIRAIERTWPLPMLEFRAGLARTC